MTLHQLSPAFRFFGFGGDNWARALKGSMNHAFTYGEFSFSVCLPVLWLALSHRSSDREEILKMDSLFLVHREELRNMKKSLPQFKIIFERGPN